MFSSRIDRIEPCSLFNKPQWVVDVIKKSVWIVVNVRATPSSIPAFSRSIRSFLNLPFALRDFYFIKVKILFMKEFVSSSIMKRIYNSCFNCKENYKNLSQIFCNNLIIFWIREISGAIDLLFSTHLFFLYPLDPNLYFL